jgi:hypothetical protein
MMSFSLDAIADWPVPAAAAAVVGRSGVLACCGDLTRVFRLASVTKPLVARAAQIAVEEGVRQITAEEGAAEAQMRYVLVRDKVGDTWPIASYREFADDPAPTSQEMLEPLAFLVGDWVDESPEGRTAINFSWSEDGNYILGEYVLSVGGQPAARSSQRIGWDPVEGVLRSWTFDSDGGFSHGEWTPVDNGWVAKTEATMPDASTASATVMFMVKDQDHFVVRSTDRIVAGGEEPDFELAIARKPPQPGTAADVKPAAVPAAK